MRKKPLQITMVLLGAIPVISGLLGMLGLADPLYTTLQLPNAPLLDSNLRFFNGIWIALGIAMWYIVPRIEHHAPVYRLIWGAIFLGGLGRVLSIGLSGMPPLPFVGFTVLEVVGAPLFIWWQHQVAKAHSEAGGTAH